MPSEERIVDNFIDECKMYSEAVSETSDGAVVKRKLNDRERHIINNINVRKQYLTPREEQFFKNISAAAFGGAREVVEGVLRDFRWYRLMSVPAVVRKGIRALNNVRRMFVNVFFNKDGKLVSLLNIIILTEVLVGSYMLYSKTKGLFQEWDDWVERQKQTVVDFGKEAKGYAKRACDFIGINVNLPSSRDLEELGETTLEALSNAWNDVKVLYATHASTVLNVTTDAFGSLKDAIQEGVEFFVGEKLNFGTLWDMYIALVSIGTMSYVYQFLGILGEKAEAPVDDNTYTVSSDAWRKTVRGKLIHADNWEQAKEDAVVETTQWQKQALGYLYGELEKKLVGSIAKDIKTNLHNDIFRVINSGDGTISEELL